MLPCGMYVSFDKRHALMTCQTPSSYHTPTDAMTPCAQSDTKARSEQRTPFPSCPPKNATIHPKLSLSPHLCPLFPSLSFPLPRASIAVCPTRKQASSVPRRASGPRLHSHKRVSSKNTSPKFFTPEGFPPPWVGFLEKVIGAKQPNSRKHIPEQNRDTADHRKFSYMNVHSHLLRLPDPSLRG